MTENDYPGNASLSAEVRQRVLATFKQTLDLYYEGKLDEVVVGCDLILEMDDRFSPAEQLREKALDPGADIDVSALLPEESSSVAPTVAADEGNADSELLEAVEALNKRDFQSAIDICNSILARFPDNEEAQKLGAKALERMEAAPFVQQFVKRCADSIAAGNADEARASLDKARSLDPLHPDIKDLAGRLDALSTEAAKPQPEAASESSPAGFDFGGDSSPFGGAFGTSSESAVPTPVEPSPEGFSTELPSEGEAFESSAFVVDSPEPAPAGGGAAPASDFGFQFEEEPAEGAAPQPTEPAMVEPDVGEAQTFDFSSAAVEVSDEDQNKVEQYLREGDEAFEKAQWQDAIDIWSRIFLIDVTNEDASNKIEAAKAKLREADSRGDELMQLALTEFQNKDYQNARKHFDEVIALDPNNLAAQEHLEKLSDLEAAMEAEAMAGAAQITQPTTAEPAKDILSDDLLEEDFAPAAGIYEGDEDLDALPPPPPPKTAPRPSPAPAVAPKKKIRVPGAAIIAIVLVVVAAGGWFGYKTFFGDAGSASDPAATQEVITRAEGLAAEGKFEEAIRLLGAIAPDDPMRQRSLELIAEYKAKRQQGGGLIGGRPRGEVFNELIMKARDAIGRKDFATAKQAFEQAATIQELTPELRQLYDSAVSQVGKLTQASLLFQQGDYDDAIKQLESLLADEPDNLNATQMLGDAHFNLGVAAIREGRLQDAMSEFDVVLRMSPGDEEAARNRDFASRYDGEPKDLLYRIYVKYLPTR